MEEEGVWDQHLQVDFKPRDGFYLTTQPNALASVNGQPVRETRLRNGDGVEIGALKMQFWLGQTRQAGLRFREWFTWAAIAALCLAQIALIYWLGPDGPDNSKQHVLGPHLQTFIIVFPNHCGIGLEQPGRQDLSCVPEQHLGFFGGAFVGAVVISGASPLRVVPMGDGVDGGILGGPGLEVAADAGGDFFKRHERLAAMQADQPRLAHVAGQQRQHRRPATPGLARRRPGASPGA